MVAATDVRSVPLKFRASCSIENFEDWPFDNAFAGAMFEERHLLSVRVVRTQYY
jgi:hypothetical protein